MTENNETPIYDDINLDKPEPILGPITAETPVESALPEPASLKPTAKVAAAGIAGAVTVLVVFAVNLIWPDLEISNEVAAAFTAIVAFAAGYIKSS